MRKNVKQQLALRVLSTAALVAMVSSIATAAFAAEYNVAEGSVEIVAKDGSQSITQWADKDKGTFVKDENGDNIDHRPDSKIVLVTKNKDTGETETTSNTVTITAENKDDTANVTLDNVHIEVDTGKAKSGAIEIKGDGHTNLELNGDNTVMVKNGWEDEHAAIEKADKYGKEGTLTIKDDVNDDGTAKTGTDADTTGKLVAGGYHEAAAIGGGAGDLGDTSNITITGGDITAIGGNNGGSGIGGGGRPGGTGKNICIEGNAHVTATAEEGAAIGGGASGGNSITIKDHAVVNAYGAWGSAIGDGGLYSGGRPTTITISGNATVHAETSQSGCAIGSGQHGDAGDLTINIEENANVTAIGSYDGPAIGNRYGDDGTTTINITGGTVNAINSFGSDDPEYSYLHDGTRDHSPAIGATIGKVVLTSGKTMEGTCNVNIDSSTGDTVVNAYIYGKGSGTAIGSRICNYSDITHEYEYQDVPADSVSYNADGSSHFGESNSAIVNCYNNGTVKKENLKEKLLKEKLDLPDTLDYYASGTNQRRYHHEITGGTLTKVVHNRKYMDENPNIDTKKLEDEDLHDWKLVGKVVQPTLEKDGYADYICSIDKCGQTKHVVLPKLTPEPSEPDTPNKPDTPKQPEGTTPAPVTPDAPVQDSTAPADTLAADTTADAAVVPAAAQNVVQDAKPEAAATAAVSAAALPQTGANWLAVVGSALSGLFLLAAGFVLDRKNRRMN